MEVKGWAVGGREREAVEKGWEGVARGRAVEGRARVEVEARVMGERA